MEDKIQAYRSPMVTATGIMLGFILNFAAAFVKSDSPLNAAAVACALLLFAGIILLIMVLYRTFNIHYPKEQAERYYAVTFKLFITGIACALGGALIDMFSAFWVD